MRKIIVRAVSYIGIATIVALIMALSSGNLKYFINYFIVSAIITFSISICEEILFGLVIKFNPEAVKTKAISVTIGVIGALLGTEFAIILMKYTMHVVVFRSLTGHFILLLLTLVIGLIVSLIMTYYRFVKYKLKEREMEIEHLKRLETESKYAVLQSKVNPHFLFNTLSTMAGMVYEEPAKVEKMILDLSSIYRTVLNLSENEMITIEEELKIARKYLEIEKMRMGERLDYQINVNKEALQCKIPPMVIEMLVENAVIHGISPKKDGGIIKIDIKKNGSIVYISIQDNGVGFVGDLREGFAITNIKNRLKMMTKESKFRIDTNGKGVNIVMEFVCEDESSYRRR
ncbi:hypothetical protein DRP44_06250 [candidate division TA06 bacterium]|uniref:Signal transduction histidine kinase internal region domain-containing protein n=1 Tax=candidate division TA06 bacterium TaxID=2250710 RepID=A0A660S6I0_UNCT6|nr:MAG: hypothetical protein DRP44_06250 [candidate division TA06 bacterium]